MALERLDDALRLFAAEQAVVDEDAGELVADRAVHERGGDGGVDAAGERADDAAVADLLADADDGVGDEVAGVQSPRQPQTRMRKLSMIALPCGVCTTSGWNWMPMMPLSLPIAAKGEESEEARGGSRAAAR